VVLAKSKICYDITSYGATISQSVKTTLTKTKRKTYIKVFTYYMRLSIKHFVSRQFLSENL